MTTTPKFDLDKELETCSTVADLIGKNGLVQRLIAGMIEKMLEKEMEGHLGHEKHAALGNDKGNSRNGVSKKTVKSSYGPIELSTPRDRDGSFEPQCVKKRCRSLGDLDDRILSMYASGMSVSDIQAHLKEIYGHEFAAGRISQITDSVMEVAREWRTRPLEEVYAIIYFDAIHFKIKQDGRVVTKAAYTVLGITLEGHREVLGIWIGEAESAKFWLGVCTELQNRGVKDILIACMDGLKGLPDAIEAVFPKTTVQLCIVHMIRNSLKYIPYKHFKEFTSDLKAVYHANSEEHGKEELEKLEGKWETRYPMAIKPWKVHWTNLNAFFGFPPAVRKIMYTTNAVEALHRQIRKTTKTKGVFPTDDSLVKMLYLTINRLSQKWTKPRNGWKQILASLAITFGERVTDHV